jgi:hypothetical protein
MIANWIQVGLGVWLILSPWFLEFSSISIMKWNNMGVGLLLVLLNVWIIFDEKRITQGQNRDVVK